MEFLNDVMCCGEIKVDGVVYRYRFNEVRKKHGDYWILIARYRNGKWEVI